MANLSEKILAQAYQVVKFMYHESQNYGLSISYVLSILHRNSGDSER